MLTTSVKEIYFIINFPFLQCFKVNLHVFFSTILKTAANSGDTNLNLNPLAICLTC